MSGGREKYADLVRRCSRGGREERSAALKEIRALSDDGLLELLTAYSRPSHASAWRWGIPLFRAAPYVFFLTACVFVLGSLLPTPIYSPACLVMLCLLLPVVVARTLVSSATLRRGMAALLRRILRQREPLELPVLTLLEGRTDRRLLPFLLAELGREVALYDRERDGSDRMPANLFMGDPGLTGRSPGHHSAEALNRDRLLRERFAKMLLALLPRRGDDATHHLSAEACTALLLPLRMPDANVELTLCLLQTLGATGSANAVRILKRLIREDHWYVGSDRVESAAREALAALEQRLHHTQQKKTLLRAGSPQEDAPQTLLRSTPSAVPADSPVYCFGLLCASRRPLRTRGVGSGIHRFLAVWEVFRRLKSPGRKKQTFFRRKCRMFPVDLPSHSLAGVNSCAGKTKWPLRGHQEAAD